MNLEKKKTYEQHFEFYYMIKKLIFFVFCLAFFSDSMSISLVYNMKIRRSFDLRSILPNHHAALAVSVLPIVYKRDSHIIEEVKALDNYDHRVSKGALLNLRYVPNRSLWFEATTGIEKEKVISCGTNSFNASRRGFDDFVFAGGYSWYPTKGAQVVLYGIAGLPARRKIKLEDSQGTLVGTRFYSLGLGSEVSYDFIGKLKNSLVVYFQDRFIHFFSRNWFPIFPQGSKIEPGNLTDLLLAVQFRHWTSLLETGYNATIFSQQAALLPTGKAATDSSVRNSFYVRGTSFWRDFPIIHRPVLLGTGINISRMKRFDTKTLSYWFNMTALF